MAKSIFVVILAEGQDAGAERLRKMYPTAYELAGNVFFIAEDEALTGTVAKALGLTKEDAESGIRGAVFRLNGSYTGFTRRTLWEWLEKAEDAE